jgi:hypothetical protein
MRNNYLKIIDTGTVTSNLNSGPTNIKLNSHTLPVPVVEKVLAVSRRHGIDLQDQHRVLGNNFNTGTGNKCESNQTSTCPQLLAAPLAQTSLLYPEFASFK